MIVHKFGGASVKSAEAVKNLEKIVRSFSRNMLVVISAMGKTTNALEIVVSNYFKGSGKSDQKIQEIKDYHYSIMHELFQNQENQVFSEVNALFTGLGLILNEQPTDNYDFEYDKIVSFGELISSYIISAWLNECGLSNSLVDARKCLFTDNIYRDARVLLDHTQKTVTEQFSFRNVNLYVTQGFIGSDLAGHTTTLGREGSDYSASILAYLLNAEKVMIWKDVKGIFNIDPRLNDNPWKLDEISYQEAIELAYYGAKVIHPKTIKPLQNKSIPLYVKSFLEPLEQGTIIYETDRLPKLIPVFIFKKNQLLISISPKDFSFIAEDNLSRIFALFAEYHMKTNMMQNSAISFSVCLDYDERKSPLLLKELQKDFRVLYNNNVELITIRHYNDEAINDAVGNKAVLLEQKSRHTVQYVVK